MFPSLTHQFGHTDYTVTFKRLCDPKRTRWLTMISPAIVLFSSRVLRSIGLHQRHFGSFIGACTGERVFPRKGGLFN